MRDSCDVVVMGSDLGGAVTACRPAAAGRLGRRPRWREALGPCRSPRSISAAAGGKFTTSLLYRQPMRKTLAVDPSLTIAVRATDRMVHGRATIVGPS